MSIIDNNRIPVIQALSNADGTSILPVYGRSSTNSISVDDHTTGSNLGSGNPDPRDKNRKVAFFAVSATDGVTPVAVYCDSLTNRLLITSI